MSNELNPDSAPGDETLHHKAVRLQRPRLLQFPALIALGSYMILLSGVICLAVAKGQMPPFFLVFSVSFIAGALGLMMMLRWGWALTLAAVLMIAGFFFWNYSMQHAGSALLQGLLNLIFFFYLVRTELREKMR
jgi:hypothetical protein